MSVATLQLEMGHVTNVSIAETLWVVVNLITLKVYLLTV
jgi:hypothetical protein